ncbi:MAG TPA: FtsX-like permease family protein [Allosphingosinicella sp.]|nr:FtsX-like permease family protein [Allosphingosinicella sp.]
MWRNYLTVGLRALAKNKTYAFINIFGLALGLAACLMILLYVRYELSYDKWLPNGENLYQLQTYYHDRETGEDLNLQMASYVSGLSLQKDFPQIEKRVYAGGGGFTVIHEGEAIAVENGSFVDGPFFDVVQLPLAKGDPASALREVGSVALSETQAAKLYGDEDPIGRTLTLMLRGEPVDHRVTAVFKDLPKNSHMRWNMIARYDPLTWYAEQPDFLTQWGWQSGWHYVALKPGTDPATIHAQMPAWEKRNIQDEDFGDRKYNAGDDQDYRLVNARDVHLGEAQRGAATPGNDRRTIVTFGIVAALILGMACVNFTNLATARASQRAREVALRKVLGANRKQLIVQFLGESILVAALAMVLALALVELLLPFFSSFLDADLSIAYVGSGGLLLPILLLVLVVGAAGGLYPAFYLSRFQPAQVLKANKSSAEAAGSGRLRNILVVAQFAVSIGLIICTAIVYAQTVYARTADPGYQRQGLLQVEGIGRRQLIPLSDTLKQEVARVDGVVAVARTNIGIATGNSIGTGVQVPGRAEPVSLGTYAIDYDFFRTMGIELLAGRAFDESRPMDDATLPFPEQPDAVRAQIARGGVNIVINELAAKRLGFQDPGEAIGRQFKASMAREEYGLVPVNIIGLVRDSRFRSIRDPIDPIMFRIDKSSFGEMMVRYDSPAPDRVRGDIERIWKRIATDAPFAAKFSDDIVAKLYEAEQARAKTFAGFALLAVVVACLGLFGLAAFTAERRTKEIGIRKVLGARSRDIVRLLAWQFSKPVIVANLIAWPVAWWVMRDWLNGFDARISLGPTPFLVAGLLALVIAVGTIAGHAFKVARSNPIHALRYE